VIGKEKRGIQEGILPESFFDAAKSKLPCKINNRCKELIDTKSSGLNGDDVSHLLDQLRVEGAGHGDGRVENSRVEGKESVEAFALDVGRYPWTIG
jgi:hypothetical protein